jgi:hypothetical protein
MIITPPLRQRGYVGHCLAALRRVEMHPNRRQYDRVELFTAGSHGRSISSKCSLKFS